MFADGPNLNGAKSLHVQRQDPVSTIVCELVRAALKDKRFGDIHTNAMLSNTPYTPNSTTGSKFKPEEVERAKHSQAGFIFDNRQGQQKMPATNYMISRFHIIS